MYLFCSCFLTLLATVLSEDASTEEPFPFPDLLESAKDKLKSVKVAIGEAFTYDFDCSFLDDDEYRLREQMGRCKPMPPPEPTTGPKPKKGVFRIAKKEVLKMVSFGKMNLYRTSAARFTETDMVIEGAVVEVECPIDAKTQKHPWKISWLVNNNEIQNDQDWRVAIMEDGTLQVWPILVDDQGLFECFYGDDYVGTLKLEVITTREALWRGFLNYCIVFGLFSPVIIFAFHVLWHQDFKISPDTEKDPLEEFYEHHLNENGRNAKENIARVVFGDKIDSERDSMKRTLHRGVSEAGDRPRNGKDTIMTLLKVNQKPKTQPVT